MQYKIVDLCAGIGGIRRGFELAGDFQNVASAEIDEFACKTYECLFHDNPRNDVTDIEFKHKLQSLQYDVLLAGFPCQAFSSVGLRQGFEDKTKGTIFFDIAQIVKMTRPKVIFLENVQNLLSHDKKATIKTIIDTLDRQLNYHIVGMKYDANGNPKITTGAFIRNTKFFGIPQNRPRVYIVAFSRDYFGDYLSMVPNETPTHRSRESIFASLKDVLEEDVEARYFMSSGYLETLEKHIVNQHAKGYGFGYRIVNSPEIDSPLANTIMASGGSGKERNLVFDFVNGEKYKGMFVKGKQTSINTKCVRTMTPTEWGRLQGFIGYGFINEDGMECFSFPEGIPVSQQYKQFGNSVSIPVIEEMARFIYNNMEIMYSQFTKIEKSLYSMYGNEFVVCKEIWSVLGKSLREDTVHQFFNIVHHFKKKEFRVKELSVFLGTSSARASQIIRQLLETECVLKQDNGLYCFKNMTSENDLL
ncbi:DNA (cytosine-5-)-methyltransferase [Anaerosporobacter sp.]|uniref:DNA (cytosine-5-)-methyltransferase n=1 Tax=Anaerosporobacter sp. TaxID=1872529 RepID=UPI00286FAE91|nr:DNA (cytosine-5-)-methyltransferase [Anaerosporobacter sp.]